MTEQECIAELERISAALDTCGSLAEARALRNERRVWVQRRHEARAAEYARTKAAEYARTKSMRTQFVRLLNLRIEALWNPCEECGEHVHHWDGWLCEDCEDPPCGLCRGSGWLDCGDDVGYVTCPDCEGEG